MSIIIVRRFDTFRYNLLKLCLMFATMLHYDLKEDLLKVLPNMTVADVFQLPEAERVVAAKLMIKMKNNRILIDKLVDQLTILRKQREEIEKQKEKVPELAINIFL